MNLLISMSECLLLWDTQQSHGWRVHQGSGVYYGISYSDDRIFVAARRFPLHGSEADAARSNGVILVCDHRLNVREELTAPFPLRDIHQILWDDGRLLVTGSYDDLVGIYESGAWRAWTPLSPHPRRERPSGGRHFNTLFREGPELYLLAHNFGPSEVFVFDAGTLILRRSFAFGNGAHNLWRQAGELLTCSSGEGRILSQRGREIRTGNFPRGIVATSEGCWVGISTFAESRESRVSHDSFLAQYDPSWRLIASHRLQGMGMIHDIRCPGVPDAAHPHVLGRPVEAPQANGDGHSHLDATLH